MDSQSVMHAESSITIESAKTLTPLQWDVVCGMRDGYTFQGLCRRLGITSSLLAHQIRGIWS